MIIFKDKIRPVPRVPLVCGWGQRRRQAWPIDCISKAAILRLKCTFHVGAPGRLSRLTEQKPLFWKVRALHSVD